MLGLLHSGEQEDSLGRLKSAAQQQSSKDENTSPFQDDDQKPDQIPWLCACRDLGLDNYGTMEEFCNGAAKPGEYSD
jgi:hypothetical protein